MTVTVTFKCGHRRDVDPDRTASPACSVCGEVMISRVNAPAPRFVGAVSGPTAETKHLEPAVVNLAPEGRLKLKDPMKED